jgi:hypothetical protein
MQNERGEAKIAPPRFSIFVENTRARLRVHIFKIKYLKYLAKKSTRGLG